MGLRKTVVTLFAAMALVIVFSVSSVRAAEPEWKIAGSPFGGTESVSAERHGTVPLVFHSELIGFKVTVTASGVSCVGCTITGGTTKSAGKLKFTGVTGVTVDINEKAAPTCAVNGGTVETKSLVDEVIMDPTAGSEWVGDKFTPASGTAFVTLAFTGAECPLNEASSSVTGTACGEAVITKGESPVEWTSLKTGQEKVTQTLLFGEAQQKTFGCELKFGTKPAQLTGAVDGRLSGANAGRVFGVD